MHVSPARPKQEARSSEGQRGALSPGARGSALRLTSAHQRSSLGLLLSALSLTNRRAGSWPCHSFLHLREPHGQR